MTSTLYMSWSVFKNCESMTRDVHAIPLKNVNTRMTKYYARFSKRFI